MSMTPEGQDAAVEHEVRGTLQSLQTFEDWEWEVLQRALEQAERRFNKTPLPARTVQFYLESMLEWLPDEFNMAAFTSILGAETEIARTLLAFGQVDSELRARVWGLRARHLLWLGKAFEIQFSGQSEWTTFHHRHDVRFIPMHGAASLLVVDISTVADTSIRLEMSAGSALRLAERLVRATALAPPVWWEGQSDGAQTSLTKLRDSVSRLEALIPESATPELTEDQVHEGDTGDD